MNHDQTTLPSVHDLWEESLRGQLNLSNEWRLHDTGWMTEEFYTKLFELAGEDNFRFVSGSSRNDWEGGPYQHATVFFNDQARANFRAYLSTRE